MTDPEEPQRAADDGRAVPADGGAGTHFEGPEWAGARSAFGATQVGDDAASRAGESSGRRRRAVSRRRLRRRRRTGIAMLVVGGLILIVGLWVAITGLLARSQLEDVRAEVHQLRAQVSAGDLAGARATARTVAAHAHRAHTLTSGPAWALAAAIPGGGAPVETVRQITTQADAVGEHVLPELVTASHTLSPSTLRQPDGKIDVQQIAAAAPDLRAADQAMSRAVRAIENRPAHTWLGPVDAARSQLLGQLSSLAGTVRGADVAAQVLPPMLGEHGVQRYFVAFQNEAEARGTGGIPGAFAILRADEGKLSFERFEPDNTLGVVPTNLNFGSDYQNEYVPDRATSLYVNSNASPNFPYAAQIWLAMWKKKSGQTLNGAMALDPTALSYLLAVTGPATLPDGTQVSAANVVALTQSTVYAKYPGTSVAEINERKAYLLAIAKASSARILNGGGSTTALVKALGHAAGERRLLVWSAEPSVQAQLARTEVSGIVPDTDQPYVGMVVVNVGGNKLDYYLTRSITWKRTGCGSYRDVTVTMTVTNNAPGHGLSPYVTDRSDSYAGPKQPGDNAISINYYATRGAALLRADDDGKQISVNSGIDRGHPVYSALVELPHGQSRTIVYQLREPAGTGAPLVLRQPLVHPLTVTIDNQACN